MSAPDRIWAQAYFCDPQSGYWSTSPLNGKRPYLAEDGPTITAYREALRMMGLDPDSIAREAEKEAQNG